MGINDRLRLIVSDQDSNPTLGKLLRIERERAGVEQGELSEAIGITRQALSTWENDKVVPPRGMVIAIAFLLGADFGPLDEAHAQVAKRRHGGSRTRGHGKGVTANTSSGKGNSLAPPGRFRPLRVLPAS